MFQFKTLKILPIMMFLLALAGCGPKAVSLAPVSGTITLGGKPLAEAQILFIAPPDGNNQVLNSAAFTDADGKYTLKSVEEQPRNGAMPGLKKVRVSFDYKIPENASLSEIDKMKLPSLPEKASDGSTTFDVPESGTDQANFDF